MEEKDDGIVVLIDENGEEVEFEHLDTVEMNGSEYVVLMPLGSEEADEADTDEVIILKVEHSAEGEDSFISVEDEDELTAVFEEFKLRVEDQYDFDEE